MSRDERVTSPAPNTIWFSRVDIDTDSAFVSPMMRLSSCRARAGTLAVKVSSRPVTEVSLTLSRYESVATMRSVCPSIDTRMPVSTGRVSSREAAFATRSTVAEITAASSVAVCSGSSSGRRGKSWAGRVRMLNDARSEVMLAPEPSAAASSVTVSPSATRTTSSSRRAGKSSEPGWSIEAAVVDVSAISVSVAARLQRSVLSVQQNASERRDGGTCRGCTRDELELGQQCCAVGGKLHQLISELVIYVDG